MVKIRPTLNNIYVNLQHLLETSNALNTCKSKNFNDITMSNQQETKISPKVLRFKNLKTYIWKYLDLFGLLRDYIRSIILSGWLRYSPIFCVRINFGLSKLINVNLNKLLKKDFSHLVPSYNNRYITKGVKLDPMWVTGFVDAL